jgi:hypothetical protein
VLRLVLLLNIVLDNYKFASGLIQNENVAPLFSSDFTSILALGTGYSNSTIELLNAKPKPINYLFIFFMK